ncbi:hypothetical protein LguiA_035037 [Lonicera macranthoides]
MAALHGLKDMTVDGLMHLHTKMWDEDLVRSIFTVRDQEEILAIPLFLSKTDDTWQWVWKNKGIYTVKSGYDYLLKTAQGVNGRLSQIGSSFGRLKYRQR